MLTQRPCDTPSSLSFSLLLLSPPPGTHTHTSLPWVLAADSARHQTKGSDSDPARTGYPAQMYVYPRGPPAWRAGEMVVGPAPCPWQPMLVSASHFATDEKNKMTGPWCALALASPRHRQLAVHRRVLRVVSQGRGNKYPDGMDGGWRYDAAAPCGPLPRVMV